MNLYFHLLLTIACHFLDFSGKDHDIHVSVTDINIENNIGSLKVKIFYDDLQKAMGLIPGESMPQNYKGDANLISNYIRKHLKINQDQKKLTIQYDKTLSSMPAIWAYFTFKCDTSTMKFFKIENDILTHLFDDQTNIVNVYINGVTTHYSLDSKNKMALLQFKK